MMMLAKDVYVPTNIHLVTQKYFTVLCECATPFCFLTWLNVSYQMLQII
ncbi:hypothetical protein BPJM79_180002 [Bacillus pumilus]